MCNMPRVIIPTTKSPEEVKDLLQMIKQTAGMPCEVLVTNGQGSASYNRNIGLEWAKDDDWVVMVDDDCLMNVPSNNWLLELSKVITRKEVVFVSATLYTSNGSEAYMTGLQDCGGRHQDMGEWNVPTKRVLTACCAFKPHRLRFDETFVGSGFEDTDLCNQLAKERPDGQFIICFNAKVIHNNERKEQLPNWQFNQALYMAKWHPETHKPLIALYKTYRGGEWFEASLESIHNHVDGIVVVASKTPWNESIAAKPENCLAPLRRFNKRHPNKKVEVIILEAVGNQGTQYEIGLKHIAEVFGVNNHAVLIIDTDEVWEPTQLQLLKTAIRSNPHIAYFRSRLHNYIKYPWWQIAPQEPHRPVVALQNAKVPYTSGRFSRSDSTKYLDVPISYHHFPLVRLDQTEIIHKLLNTSSQDGPIHNNWIEEVWDRLPEGKDIHPAVRYEQCWGGVKEVSTDILPIEAKETSIFCKLLTEAGKAGIIYKEKLNLKFIDLPRFHRKFGQCGMNEGLINLIKHTTPRNVVEVGSATGESTEIFCQMVSKVTAIDNWQPNPEEPEAMYENEEIFDLRTNRFHNLTKFKCNSLNAAREFRNRSLDLVYLDADHNKDSVVADIQAWLPKVKHGGFIAGHDYIWHNEVRDAVNELLGAVRVFEDTSWAYQVK